MAIRFHLADEAKADLMSTWRYIANDNPDAADGQLRRILDAFDILKEYPLSGRQAPELGDNFHQFPVDKYRIVHRVEGNLLELLRVLHSARDIQRVIKG